MRHNNIITIIAACFIIVIGIIVVPVLDFFCFKPEIMLVETDLYEDNINSSYEKTLKELEYPRNESTRELNVDELESFIKDMKAFSESEYEEFFGLAGINYSEGSLHKLRKTENGNFMVLAETISDQRREIEFEMIIYDFMPVAIRYRSAEEPSEQEMKNAKLRLEEILDGNQSDIEQYVNKIENLYEINKLVARYSLVYSELIGDQNEITQGVGLWDLCKDGEWRILKREKEMLLLSICGNYTFQFYYDPVECQFSGYSLVLNKFLYK